jgi:hypothetical protein
MHQDELTTAAELHAGKRRLLVTLLGNALLLVVMLGIPFARGYFRTRATWDAFGAYGACLYGGKALAEPGLGMPRGHEATFASRALREPGFASACDAALATIAPDEAIFIMPGLKTAEADLRAAVKLVRDELAPLSARTPGTRLSKRPLLALERLRAALANHATATGIVSVPEGDAFMLPRGGVLPTPARLPLYAGANAVVSLWGSDVELQALATDSNGISHVHVRAGKVEQTRAPRPKLLSGAVPRELPALFVWSMSQARCLEREGGCADKALGVARVQLPTTSLPTPRWLAAHPSGRIDRSVYRQDARILVAALASDGATELREFELSAEAEASASADMPPLASTQTWAPRAHGSTLIVPSAERPVVLAAVRAERSILMQELTSEQARPLAELEGAGAPWLVACSSGSVLGFAFGHDEALRLGTRAEDGTVTTWEPLRMPLQNVVDGRDGARDRVLPLCSADGALAALLDRGGRLQLVRCRAGETSCRAELVAPAVRSFAAVAHGGRVTVAYAGDGEATQVRVRSAAVDVSSPPDEQVPSACWSDSRGLCGAPLLVHVGNRLLLGTREATDLMLLESSDGGGSWQPLKGLGRRD